MYMPMQSFRLDKIYSTTPYNNLAMNFTWNFPLFSGGANTAEGHFYFVTGRCNQWLTSISLTVLLITQELKIMRTVSTISDLRVITIQWENGRAKSGKSNDAVYIEWCYRGSHSLTKFQQRQPNYRLTANHNNKENEI